MNARALTEFFVKRPIIFWSFVVGILLIGVLSYFKMPKLEDPAVAVKQASVVLVYPGATAHEVELEAVQVMEDELRTLADVKELTTDCRPNMAIIGVKFQQKVKMSEMEQHFDQLRRKANDVQSKLPSGCYAPIVVDDMLDVYGLFYAFMGDGYSYAELEKYAKLVRRELLTVKGVKRINIIGTRPEVINIIIDKEKLARTGILPTQVMIGLQNAGKTVNAGNYENDDDRLQLRVNNELEDEKDIADLHIRTTEDKLMRLGDIAKVERNYKEPQTGGFFVDGKPALGICITLNDDAIVPDVGKAVDKKLAEVKDRLPVGFETDKIFFQAVPGNMSRPNGSRNFRSQNISSAHWTETLSLPIPNARQLGALFGNMGIISAIMPGVEPTSRQSVYTNVLSDCWRYTTSTLMFSHSSVVLSGRRCKNTQSRQHRNGQLLRSI